MGIKTRLLGGGDEAIARARRPEELAASLDVAPLEGIDWLGHAPDAQAPRLYRLLVAFGRAFLLRICRIRVEVSGMENLPTGGFIAVCALHRSWIDAPLVVHALPTEPRVWFLGSGATAFDRPWKERLLRRTGGLLPVWRGGTDISVHVRSAAAVVEQGAVLALFAEGRIGGSPAALSKMRAGSALLCLRTGAPIVPIAVAGADELYRGKRIAVRILEPTDPARLLGQRWSGTPEAGSRDELRVAHELTEAIGTQLAPEIEAGYRATKDPSRPAAPLDLADATAAVACGAASAGGRIVIDELIASCGEELGPSVAPARRAITTVDGFWGDSRPGTAHLSRWSAGTG